MAVKSIEPLGIEIGFDLPVVPTDYNPFANWSLDFQDVFGLEHRVSDGSHSARNVAIAAATVVGGAITEAAGISAVNHLAAGRFKFTLNPVLADALSYFAIAWPVGFVGTDLYVGQDSERYAVKSTSQFEIELTDKSNADVDRDFVVIVFGPRTGEVAL